MNFIDYTPLRMGIMAYKKGNGTYVDLARATDYQVTNSTIARIAKGYIASPSLELWLALHHAAPQYIPLPNLERAKARKNSTAWANNLLPRLAMLNRQKQKAVEQLLANLLPETATVKSKKSK